MKIEEILALEEGPSRTAALVAWLQSLFDWKTGEPPAEEIEKWANTGP